MVRAAVTFLRPPSECIPVVRRIFPKHKQVSMSDEVVVTIHTTLLVDAPIDCSNGTSITISQCCVKHLFCCEAGNVSLDAMLLALIT